MKYYTGVGSRKTPTKMLAAMTRVAGRLEKIGYTLRSGAAGGADAAFEAGVDKLVDSYIPWAGFSGSTSSKVGASVEAMKIAEELHPAWDRCSQGARKLHGRNVHQVLGDDLRTPSEFLICWTPRGEKVGGTATAINLAEENGVMVFNLALKEEMNDFNLFLISLESR